MPPTLLRAGAMLALVTSTVLASSDPGASLTVQADELSPVINRNIYGQFSEHLGHCIYDGIWVGKESAVPNTDGYSDAVLAALQDCMSRSCADRAAASPTNTTGRTASARWRKGRRSTTRIEGGVVENNHFGTHEFLNLCERLGIEPYVCLNVGSGSVQEAMEWVEYMTSDAQSPMANLRRANGRDKPWKVRYVAVGNESWGCGGDMRPEFYADNFRRYNTFVKNYGSGPGSALYRVACGPSDADYEWTDTLMKIAGTRMDGLALHHYTIATGDWAKKGSATEFGPDLYYSALGNTMKMEDRDPPRGDHGQVRPDEKVEHDRRRVGRIWTDVEPGTNPGFLYQQNSMRRAVDAALNLHIFQAHAERVRGANIAQMVNVLQAMILTDRDRIVLTPTYHVFEMFRPHQGAVSLPVSLHTRNLAQSRVKIPEVSASASRDEAGRIHLSLVNTNPDASVEVACKIAGAEAKAAAGRILTAGSMTAHNTFEAPHTVEPQAFSGASVTGGTLTVTLPALSVVILEI